MSAPLRDTTLRYPTIDKQAYALVKAVKKFQHYILHNQIIAIALDPTVKNLLTKQELGTRRGNWVTTLQELDISIQPMKIIRGQGLTKTLASCQDEVSPSPSSEDIINNAHQVCQNNISHGSWYTDIGQYITSGVYPSNYTSTQKRALRYKAAKYLIRDRVLYRKNYHWIFFKCLEKGKACQVLQEFHDQEGETGHTPGNALAHQILRARYY